MLTGCDASEHVRPRSASRPARRCRPPGTTGIQAVRSSTPTSSRPNLPRPTMLQRPPRFNAYYDVDAGQAGRSRTTWRLELAGADRRPHALDAGRCTQPPSRNSDDDHPATSASRAGTTSASGPARHASARCLRAHAGADLRGQIRRLFHTADDYPTSIDMATALHPQTLLAIAICRRRPCPTRSATRCACAPRPSSATRTPKWITADRGDQHLCTGGYWEERGFNWFAGI